MDLEILKKKKINIRKGFGGATAQKGNMFTSVTSFNFNIVV